MKARRGFTLIELMLVVAIIGLLAGIALPKFANLVIKAKEAAVKGRLGSLRSAVSIYYANQEGTYPAPGLALRASLVPIYIDAIPTVFVPTVPAHGENDRFALVVNDLDFSDPTQGGWVYSGTIGGLLVNCTHTDSKGTTWSLW